MRCQWCKRVMRRRGRAGNRGDEQAFDICTEVSDDRTRCQPGRALPELSPSEQAQRNADRDSAFAAWDRNSRYRDGRPIPMEKLYKRRRR